MKLAMLACLAALCLAGPIAHAAPGEASRPAVPAHGQPVEASASHPAATAGEAGPRQGVSARIERRRRSYAACNRASHQRGLRGGKRRRFLIRCRLGYERTRGQTGQSAGPSTGQPAAPSTGQAAGQPAQPGRKP
ncbi:hypothetical protein SAMN05216360_113101 [Methylobacterium phyllostachyos]|uniref:Serine/threonine protein kinase n=1 Tax=Methylobacterium phyllostachyos TaxID=582672 RepID=A0A1H0FU81_9HYPH|nr:hypothetical protein [Methylobacterium phyllostachyos]SDN98213.1 hypothetical protein SAMN05216360_113101 [Methylobacterium phyllostachyos]